jgi:hypothetical protein
VGLGEVASARGWAASEVEVDCRRAVAAGLIGGILARVRYFAIDYEAMNVTGLRSKGLRAITSSEELARPYWKRGLRHTVDYGVELTLADRRGFFVTWDLPGVTESLALLEGFGEQIVRSEGGIAVWDVSQQPPWSTLIGIPIQNVELDYAPWGGEAGFYCTRAVIRTSDFSVQLLLDDLDEDGNFLPSVDNVVVIPGDIVPPHA